MAKSMASDDAAPRNHNVQAIIDKIRDVDRRMAPLEAQRDELNADIREIRRELKDFDIDATYFNWMRRLHQMEDIDARDRAIDNIRMVATAFKVGGQAGLFVDAAEAQAAQDGEDIDATLDAIEARGKDAGLEGKTLSDVNTHTPGSAAAARFEKGWKAGQKVLLGRMAKKSGEKASEAQGAAAN